MGQTIYPLPSISAHSLREVKETRKVALFTSAPAFLALGDVLDLDIVWECEPVDAAIETFEELAGAIPETAEIIYSIGGGLPVDAAKFAALQRNLPHVAIPTALSVDAHLTPASGIRRNGCVYYIETAAPDRMIIDWEVIAAAPAYVRAAGICDVLSISTGLWDWQFAEERAMNAPNQQMIPYVRQVAEALLDEACSIAESAGKGEVSGLSRLLELLGLEVQLCNFIGHSRPEEGSEHAFAYSVENLVGKGLPHGDLVGPGILAMAAAQGQETGRLREALLASGARLDKISPENATRTFTDLPGYVETHDLPFGMGHVLDDESIDRAYRAVWT